MRIVVATCEVDYTGRIGAHLPLARRLIMIKADGSVSIHADGGAYKPLNWMTPPCTLSIDEGSGDSPHQVWRVQGKGPDVLTISITEVDQDLTVDLGNDPGLEKDGVEKHLQKLLAAHPETIHPGMSLVRREYSTAIGPVDLLCRDQEGCYVAVEIKRRGEIDGVEQLTRYLELMRRDPLLGNVKGIFAAQAIKPQARTLAKDRGIDCVTIDYEELRGMKPDDDRLF